MRIMCIMLYYCSRKYHTERQSIPYYSVGRVLFYILVHGVTASVRLMRLMRLMVVLMVVLMEMEMEMETEMEMEISSSYSGW